MILLPAIDIRAGRAVRLVQGDFARERVYADSPLEAARDWVQSGAAQLHLVDLDGARAGHPANLEHVSTIAAELDVGLQLGGGLRSLDDVAAALEAGVDRVVLGTAALRDPGFARAAVEAHGERVLVAVDAREGRAAVSGWAEGTGERTEDVIARLAENGATRFVYTSVERDGTLEGVDPDEVRRISDAVGDGSFVYSGGVATLADLEALRDLALPNLTGVIAGKALYEARFTVEEAQVVLGER